MRAVRTEPINVLLRTLWLATLLWPFTDIAVASWPLHAGISLAYALLLLLALPIFQMARAQGQVLWLGLVGTAVLLLRSGGGAGGPILIGYVAMTLLLLGTSEADRFRGGWRNRWTHRIAAAAFVGLLLLLPMALGAATLARLLPGRPLAPGLGGASAPGEPPAAIAAPAQSLVRVNLSGPVSLSDTPVFTIEGGLGPAYWEMATYDQFDGQNWVAPPESAQIFTAPTGESLLQSTISGFPTREWNVTIHRLNQTAGPLIYTGTPAAPAGSPAIEVQPQLRALWAPNTGDYRLQLAVPEIDPTSLQTAPFRTPTADLQKDLALPPDLSPQLAVLARSVAGSADGPWQAAQRVSDYLRAQHSYSTQFALAGGNVVNGFLLGSGGGYCDQFSTSFVVLMRELGLPARWVMGYRVTNAELQESQYVVRARNAHSWAEVYIGPYGWIPVDPTPGGELPGAATVVNPSPGPLQNPPDLSGTPAPAQGPGPAQTGSRPASSGWSLTGKIALAIVILMPIGLFVWRRQVSGKSAARRRTDRLWRSLSQLAGEHDPSLPTARMTPREVLALLPEEGRQEIIPVVRLLEQAWYSEKSLPAAEIAAAESLLRAALKHAQRATSFK